MMNTSATGGYLFSAIKVLSGELPAGYNPVQKRTKRTKSKKPVEDKAEMIEPDEIVEEVVGVEAPGIPEAIRYEEAESKRRKVDLVVDITHVEENGELEESAMNGGTALGRDMATGSGGGVSIEGIIPSQSVVDEDELDL
jgi:hypothetical protein